MKKRLQNLPAHLAGAWRNLIRHISLTVSSVIAVTVTLLIVGVLMVVAGNISDFTDNIESDFQIQATISPGFSEDKEIAELQAQIEEYSVILQVIGGIFVVIVGVYIFFQNPVPQIRKNRAGRYNLWQDFSSMFVFTLANFVVVIPYLLAFFAMFNVGMDGSEDVASLLRSGATIVGFFLGAVLWWILLTLTIDLFRRRFRPRHMLTINHVAGIIIALLGIYTILSTFFTVLPHGL